MKKLLFVLLAVLGLSQPLFAAANISGTWTGTVKIGDQLFPLVVQVKQEGDTITGRVDGVNGAPDIVITDGKIVGDTVTFGAVHTIGKEDLKFIYTGTISGDTIDYKILRADGTGLRLSSLTKRLGTPPLPAAPPK
jgi:hypothetical protein